MGSAEQRRARLQRDRLTWLVYLQLGAWGWFLYGFGPTVPLLRDELHVTSTVAGLHGMALAAGALVTTVLSPSVARRFGRGAALWGGLGGVSAGAVLYVVGPAVPMTLLGAFVAGVGGSMVVNAVPPVLGEYHGDAGAASISEANAVAAGVGILAPLGVGLAASTALGWRAGLVVVIPAVGLLLVLARGVRVPPVASPALPTDGARAPLGAPFWFAWGVLLCSIAVEFCFVLWAAALLQDRAGLGDGGAAAGVAAFVVGMCAGRLLGGQLALRFPVGGLLVAALVTASIGFAGFWSSTAAGPALAGLVVTGLGVALLYPLGITRAIAASGGRPDHATGRVSFGAALAIGAGPFALGALVDAVGIHRAFLVVPVLLAAALAGLLAGDAVARRAAG